MYRFFGIITLIIPVFFTSCKSCNKSENKRLEHEKTRQIDTIKQIIHIESISDHDTCKITSEKKAVIKENITEVPQKQCRGKRSLIHKLSHKKADTIIHVRTANEIPKRVPIPFLPDFYGEAITSINRYFLLRFDNDIFIEKDYYYTNGASLGIIHPKLQHFFIYKTLPTLGRYSLNYNLLTLNHEMFTAVDPEQTKIDFDDRPFCGTLFLEFGKISISKEKQLLLQSSLKLGVIGNISLASFFQHGIHNNIPSGWKFQIKNDVIINGLISVQKGLLLRRYMDLSGILETSFGSYMTYLSVSPKLKIGKFASSYDIFHTARANTLETGFSEKIQYTFFLEPEIRYVFHNATLNGGLFNHNNLHTFKKNQINKLIFKGKAGITFFFKQHGISFCYINISPEFEQGKSHGWGSVNYIFNF